MNDRLERELEDLKRLRAIAIDQMRLSFQRHGFDVADYDDDQLSRAVLDEVTPSTSSSRGLFTRAYARLHACSDVERRGMTARSK